MLPQEPLPPEAPEPQALYRSLPAAAAAAAFVAAAAAAAPTRTPTNYWIVRRQKLCGGKGGKEGWGAR